MADEYLSFDGTVIAVTGGSKGIGAAVVRDLVSLGASVFFTYFSSENAAMALEAELADASGCACALKCDVTKPKEVKAFFDRIRTEKNALDALLTCAGTIGRAPVAFTKPDMLDSQLDVHLKGSLYSFQNAMKLMTGKRYGRIVAVSSVASLSGYGNHSAYAAAKAALNALVKSAAREFAPFNITVNAVLPGYTDTDIISGFDTEKRAKTTKHIPLMRIAQPAEIASLIVFLLHKRASYVTGSLIRVDGGLGM